MMSRGDAWRELREVYGEIRAPEGLAERVMAGVRSGVREETGRWWWVWAGVAAMVVASVSAVVVWTMSTETVTFAYAGSAVESVALVGDFNGWSKEAMRLRRNAMGAWSVTVRLKRGVYRYQFLVDGTEWSPDPSNPVVVEDGYGGKVSVIEV